MADAEKYKSPWDENEPYAGPIDDKLKEAVGQRNQTARSALLKEVVEQYGADPEPLIRARVLRAKRLLAMHDTFRPEEQKRVCREVIAEYFDDTYPETMKGVLDAANTLLSVLRGDMEFDKATGGSRRNASEADRAEAVALCDRILARYGNSGDEDLKRRLVRFEDIRRELLNDPDEVKAHVAKNLKELLNTPEKLWDESHRLFDLEANATGRPVSELITEWTDAILRSPVSPAVDAAVRRLRIRNMSPEQTHEANVEFVRLYGDSDDPFALRMAASALSSCLLWKKNPDPKVTPWLDRILARRSLLPSGKVAELLFCKSEVTKDEEEKLRIYDEILRIALEAPSGDVAHDGYAYQYLSTFKRLAVGRKAMLPGQADSRLVFFRRLAAEGLDADHLSQECLYLVDSEPDSARRTLMLDEAIASCRAAGPDCRAHHLISLLVRKADGMRDADAAMALYREALDLAERDESLLNRNLLSGMLRLTPDRAGKAALYDRFIEPIRDSIWSRFADEDELAMERAALLGDDAEREKVFASVFAKRDDHQAFIRESRERLADALRDWLAECAAAGRDPNDLDGVVLDREGETLREARQKRLTSGLESLGVYADDEERGWMTKPHSKPYFTVETAMSLIEKVPDSEKRRAALGLVLKLYGGVFDSRTLGYLQKARAALKRPECDFETFNRIK